MNEDIPQLTTGLCDQLASSTCPQDPSWPTPPTVQILQAKAVEGNGRALWRIIISDGTHILQLIVSPQLNALFENGHVGNGSIVRLQDVKLSPPIGGRRQVIPQINNPPGVQPLNGSFGMSRFVTIHGLEILVKETGRIGNPTLRTLDPRRPTLSIGTLNPYSNNWTIKARVSQKSGIINWSNQNGQGTRFNITLIDGTGEIRGNCFGSAVDQLHDKFEEGKVYYISKARVNLAKKQFNNAANDFELVLDKNTEVEEVRTKQHRCLLVAN
jgi:replication factor A1